MRVLLINPHYPIAETPSPPLGLAFLAAALEAAGAEVRILDFVVFPYRYDIVKKVLRSFQPHLTGITAVTMTVNAAMAIVREVKQSRPDTITVMGGPHTTYNAKQTLAELPELDVIVIGEGEQTLVELAQAVVDQRRLDRVHGIAFRKKGLFQQTAARPLIRFDALPPPARHLLPLGRYRALGLPISITTSRGCPYPCSFCVGGQLGGRRVRYRCPSQVVDELEEIAAFGFHQINVADDLFTANSRHCLAICNQIIRRGLKLRWTAFARADTVSAELLTTMKAAGCVGISFGVESANRDILKTIKKGIVPDQVETAVALCRRAAISPYASFILGLPGETPQTLQETLAFAKRLQKHGLAYGFHLLAPFPGTEIRRRHRQLGIKILTNDWDQYHANRAVVETDTVSRFMLDRIAIEWEKEYDAYLKDIQQRMRTGRASNGEIAELKNLERICLRYELMMTGALTRLNPQDFPSTMSQDQALMHTARKLSTTVKHATEDIFSDLQECLSKGHMRWIKHRKGRQLAWVDDLPKTSA